MFFNNNSNTGIHFGETFFFPQQDGACPNIENVLPDVHRVILMSVYIIFLNGCDVDDPDHCTLQILCDYFLWGFLKVKFTKIICTQLQKFGSSDQGQWKTLATIMWIFQSQLWVVTDADSAYWKCLHDRQPRKASDRHKIKWCLPCSLLSH
jgi:hypothetical protein